MSKCREAFELADKRIEELEAKIDEAYKKGYATGEEEAEHKLSVAREALKKTGHTNECRARCCKGGDEWIDETKCDCCIGEALAQIGGEEEGGREMNEELKQLIEDAAKLLGHRIYFTGPYPPYIDGQFGLEKFNPRDPERGDLMKVAMAAMLLINFENETVSCPVVLYDYQQDFAKDDYQSLALAILRAASAVLHSRGGV